MKRNHLILTVVLTVMLTACLPESNDQEVVFDPERLLTFSEDGLPGSEPEPFGRGWFRGGFHSAPIFSPDGNSFWWADKYATQIVYVSHYDNGIWRDQEKVSFSDEISSYRDPFISPDGMKFYFISTEPIPEQDNPGKENYWMMEWEAEGWGVPQPISEGGNSMQLHWTPSAALNYDFYFSANVDGNPDIFVSEFRDGVYQDPVPLGYPVSTEEMEFTPIIAPDQSYLLFSRAKDGNTPALLYISYASDEGWTEPVQVENVESCISPIVTPDGGYVIYLEGPSNLAWRDTTFIDELKPD